MDPVNKTESQRVSNSGPDDGGEKAQWGENDEAMILDPSPQMSESSLILVDIHPTSTPKDIQLARRIRGERA